MGIEKIEAFKKRGKGGVHHLPPTVVHSSRPRVIPRGARETPKLDEWPMRRGRLERVQVKGMAATALLS